MRPTPGERPRARLRARDAGVSPVVGMVLVLAISVLGITGVLMWGLPAINEMKASVEHQSVVTEFHALVADIQELAKATASKTAKLWRFSQSQGDFSLQPRTERMVVLHDGVSTKREYSTYTITVFGLDDTDNKFAVVNNELQPTGGAVAGLKVNLKGDFIDGSATIPLKWATTTAGSACPSPPTTITTADLPWKSGANPGVVYFCLYETVNGVDTPIVLRDRLLQVQLTNNALPTETVAWVWVADVGRVQWKLATATASREAYVSNGVVLQGSNGGLVIDGDPTITPPAKSGGSFRFFARLITVNGTASLGGQARIDVLLNLYGSRALADEVAGNATKIWTYGNLQATWDTAFKAAPYSFVEKTEAASGAPAGTKYVEYKPTLSNGSPAGLKLILHHSVITAKG